MTKIIIDNYKKLSNNIEKLKNASLNDVANFIKENRVQILKLENDSFLKLPKIRDLYIKEISLQIKKDQNSSKRDVLLVLEGHKNQTTVKQILVSGTKKEIFNQFLEKDFSKKFETNYNSLKYYLQIG